MDYKNKYLKYKNKYIALKGGINFDTIFIQLIEYCITFNKNNRNYNIDEFINGDYSIIHIIGGASIKYNMIRREIDSTMITNDIDIYLISGKRNEKNNNFNYFFEGLQQFGGNWTFKKQNTFYVILYEEQPIFDITLYYIDDEDGNEFIDEDTSMVYNACIKL